MELLVYSEKNTEIPLEQLSLGHPMSYVVAHM